MSTNTSKKVVNNTVNVHEKDELDELEDQLSNSTTSSNTLKKFSSNNTVNKQYIFKNAKPEIQSKLIDDSSDLYDNIDSDKPKNYGNRWSEEDKKQLIELLKQNQSQNKEINYIDIATKLGRSEGGIKGEVKKMILSRYLNGEDPESIALDINIQYKFVKILIKTYIENEIDSDINNLEKENKLLKLKMENMELRKSISKLVSNK